MLIAEGVVHLASAHRPAPDVGVAGGLVLDLVLARAASLDDRQRLRLTGNQPTDPPLAAVVAVLAAKPRPPRAGALVGELAKLHRREGLPPPEPIGAMIHASRRRRREQSRQAAGGGSTLIPAVHARAAERRDDEADALRRSVSALLTGADDPDGADVLTGADDYGGAEPRLHLLAGLSLADDLVRGLVHVDDLDVARQRAAAIAMGRAQPIIEATPTLRHAAATVLPAVAR